MPQSFFKIYTIVLFLKNIPFHSPFFLKEIILKHIFAAIFTGMTLKRKDMENYTGHEKYRNYTSQFQFSIYFDISLYILIFFQKHTIGLYIPYIIQRKKKHK